MQKQEEIFTNFHMPRWNDLPDIDLYLDQVVNYLERFLEICAVNKDEKIITKTMINNYVKQGIIPAPEKKKYNRSQIAYLLVICILKQVYSINDIGNLISITIKSYDISKAYDGFCTKLEIAVKNVFNKREFLNCDNLTEEQYLLNNIAQSFANKLYVEVKYLDKKEETES